MTWTPATWQNEPNHSTPLGASKLNDLESRIGSAFTDAAAATAAAQAASQPLDSDLTAIAALTTTSFGRAFLALADAAAGRTALGLGTAATHATGDYDAAGAAAAAQAASQPLDSDLTSIAALSTTSFGRSVLTQADAAALRTLAGAVIGTDVQAHDSDLDSIAALSTTSFGRSLLAAADAAALRTLADSPSNATLTAATAALAGVYSERLRTSGRVSTSGASATTYLAIPANLDQTGINASAAPASSLPMLNLVAADLAVSGLTSKLRVRASVLTIATAPAITITIGLYPLTIASSLVVPGTVIAASTVAIASPGINAITTGVTSDFTLPSDGPFAVGYTLSMTPTAAFTLQAQIQSRSV